MPALRSTGLHFAFCCLMAFIWLVGTADRFAAGKDAVPAAVGASVWFAAAVVIHAFSPARSGRRSSPTAERPEDAPHRTTH